ncbi:TlpA disulfide reductase family protein [Nisaea acidiphila]|uniref:TlpA disulfide reductase family protein n=1 Tax=Nisaea acidiphila TaxID=1862145 RepID=UPI003565CF5C
MPVATCSAEGRMAALTGTSKGLGDFRGRAVLVNLWATWCPPCVAEMPSLDRLQDEFDRGVLTILALSQDHGGKRVVSQF